MENRGGKWSQENYTKAYRFAAQAHNGQLFPGTDLPYIMHISFVSMEIIACLGVEGQGDGDFAVQCALLHDVIEDTKITYQEVKNEFGERVAQGVLALTKNPEIGKELQVKDSLERIGQQPVEVWMVKLADRITNLAPPPSFWEKGKIRRYREEAMEINRVLQGASPYLSKRLEMKIEDYGKYI
jgi:(p)ppGpp synthase/HD superfamily hydrolase